MESRYSSCYRGTRVLRIQHLQPSISLGLTKPETCVPVSSQAESFHGPSLNKASFHQVYSQAQPLPQNPNLVQSLPLMESSSHAIPVCDLTGAALSQSVQGKVIESLR